MTEERIQRMIPLLNERQRRLYLANEAVSYDRGGVSLVSRISGMSRAAITKALGGLDSGHTIDGNIRRSGGGRTFAESKYPDIEGKIRKIIDGKPYEDPMRVLPYTTEVYEKYKRNERRAVFLRAMSRQAKYVVRRAAANRAIKKCCRPESRILAGTPDLNI